MPVSEIGEAHIPVHGPKTGEKEGRVVAGDGLSSGQEFSISSHQRNSSGAHSLRVFFVGLY